MYTKKMILNNPRVISVNKVEMSSKTQTNAAFVKLYKKCTEFET